MRRLVQWVSDSSVAHSVVWSVSFLAFSLTVVPLSLSFSFSLFPLLQWLQSFFTWDKENTKSRPLPDSVWIRGVASLHGDFFTKITNPRMPIIITSLERLYEGMFFGEPFCHISGRLQPALATVRNHLFFRHLCNRDHHIEQGDWLKSGSGSIDWFLSFLQNAKSATQLSAGHNLLKWKLNLLTARTGLDNLEYEGEATQNQECTNCIPLGEKHSKPRVYTIAIVSRHGSHFRT